MGNRIGRIFSEDPAYPRFRDLIEALGYEPSDPQNLAVLADFAKWGGHEHSARMAGMLRQARDVQQAKEQAILCEIAEHIRAYGSRAIALPEDLVSRILGACS